MTPLLQKAFAAVASLPDEEQDYLATQLLAELDAEDAFDRAISNSGDKLARLAVEALDEYRAGDTAELDPDAP